MIRRSSELMSLLAVATLLAAPGLVHAAEGRIPIPFASPVVLPINITADGSYILTRSLSAAGTALRVTAPGTVSLDLNGMTLTTADTTAPAIDVATSGQVTIRNGFVNSGRYGISSDTPSTLVIADIGFTNQTGNGIAVQGQFLTTLHVTGCRFRKTGAGAIYAKPRWVRIDGNVIDDNGSGIGIDFDASSAPSGVISNNMIRNCTGDGMHLLRVTGMTIRNNEIIAVNRNAIFLDGGGGPLRGNHIDGNKITGAGNAGIVVEAAYDGVVIKDNRVNPLASWTSPQGGISVSADNVVLDGNSASGLTGLNSFGIWLKSPSSNVILRGNNMIGNGATGLCLGGSDYCSQGTAIFLLGDNFLNGAKQ